MHPNSQHPFTAPTAISPRKSHDWYLVLVNTVGSSKISFDHNKGFQLEPGMGFAPRRDENGAGIVVVDSLEAAKSAITEIILQGEGGVSSLETSHWARFKRIAEAIKNKGTTEYSVYPMMLDSNIHSYDEFPDVQKVVLAFNASYCYLLLILQRAWQTSDAQQKRMLLVGGMPALMKGVLTPLATFLASKPINSGTHAGPSFGYFEYRPIYATPKTQLLQVITDALAAFSTSPILQSVLSVVSNLPDVPVA